MPGRRHYRFSPQLIDLLTIRSLIMLAGVMMVLAASCEFDKRLNSEITERPSDNEEIPEVRKSHT